MVTLLTILVAVAIIAIAVGLQRSLAPESRRLEQRLARYGARNTVVLDETTGETRQQSAAAAAVTGMVGRSIQGRSFAQDLQADLNRANLKLTAAEFLSIQAAIGLILGLTGTIILQNPAAIVILGGVGFYAPKWWVKRRENARLKAFNEQLADTIALMSNSLRSGMSLLQAMEMISREGAEPIGPEFSRVVREIGLGVSPQDALEHLVRRIKSDDLDLMVTAILVQHEVGGNLSKILDTIAFTIRERVKIKGEIRAITGQQRLAGYMLAGLPVFVTGILALIAPKYIFAFITPVGPWTALPICAVLGIVFGFLVIQKVVAIEV
ncbi:MAG: type secretion system protein [Chloroflexi bacterium]|nr:type secretion system protein [Chloroflexota bacterium]